MTDFEREHMGFVLWKWHADREDDSDPTRPFTYENWQTLTIESEKEEYRQLAEMLAERLLNNLAVIGVGLEQCRHCGEDRRVSGHTG